MIKSNAVILAVLMTVSCAGQPVVGVCPPLPVPDKPEYPQFRTDEFTPVQGMSDYFILSRDTLGNMAFKDVLCRSYAAEMRATLLETHQ